MLERLFCFIINRVVFSVQQMTFYPIINDEPELLKKTRDEEIKNLKNQTQNKIMRIY